MRGCNGVDESLGVRMNAVAASATADSPVYMMRSLTSVSASSGHLRPCTMLKRAGVCSSENVCASKVIGFTALPSVNFTGVSCEVCVHAYSMRFLRG